MIQAVLKDTMVNTHKTMGDGCWILGVDFHSTCQNVLTACQVRIFFMKKNIFLHEEKYFSS